MDWLVTFIYFYAYNINIYKTFMKGKKPREERGGSKRERSTHSFDSRHVQQMAHYWCSSEQQNGIGEQASAIHVSTQGWYSVYANMHFQILYQ